MNELEILDSLTLRNMQYNYKKFYLHYKTQEKTLEAMARIYPKQYIPVLKQWLEETTINFQGGK
jgi:flagellar biosynthesis/type III secretory pathway M-ring protein FliF/YscJ